MTWDARSRRGAVTQTSRWRKLRAQVLQRDERRCYVCGGPDADTVDHIVPVSRGGTDDPSNLAAIHDRPCHRAKTAREGQQAARDMRARGRHPIERHPGLIR